MSLDRQSKQRKEVEREFAYRPDDVVLASYPKSGSSWVRFILANLIAPESEADFLATQLLVPEISRNAMKHHAIDFEKLPSPRIMRTHALRFPECPRAIYLLRDGRDVMVSFYFHHKKFHAFAGTFLDFLRSDVRTAEWDEHVASWLFENPPRDGICVVRYEELLTDTFSGIKMMIEFSGLQSSDEQLRRAIERSTFDKMKAAEEKKGLGYTQTGDATIAFVRKGESGNWREYFGDAEKKIFKERYGEVLIKADYESSPNW
jgi:hypothetical protein